MKNIFRKLSVAVIAYSAILSCVDAAELTETQLFNDTVKNVDMGGLDFQYSNTTNLSQTIQSVVDMIAQMPAANPQEQMIKQAIPPIAKELINTSGLKSVKAIATSYKTNKNSYVLRSFYYTGANPIGFLFDISKRTNSKFNLMSKIPDNALFVWGGYLTPNLFWTNLKTGLAQNPQLSMLPTMAEIQLESQYKVKLPVILDALNGEYFAACCGTLEDMELFIQIPDKNGVIAQLIKNNVPLVAGANGTMKASVELNKELGTNGLTFRFSANFVEVATSAEFFAACNKNSGLNTIWGKNITALAPQGGLFYMAGELPKEFFKAINEPAPASSKIFGVDTVTPTGYSSLRISDFDLKSSFTKAVFTLASYANKLTNGKISPATK